MQTTAQRLDATAVTISALCVVHCLALPLLAAGLPVLGALAEAEWIHKGLVLSAIPVSILAFTRTHRATGKVIGLALLAGLGLSILMSAAFIEAAHDYETPLTVTGASLLAIAHILRWRRLER